jgi:hypothetical protein
MYHPSPRKNFSYDKPTVTAQRLAIERFIESLLSANKLDVQRFDSDFAICHYEWDDASSKSLNYLYQVPDYVIVGIRTHKFGDDYTSSNLASALDILELINSLNTNSLEGTCYKANHGIVIEKSVQYTNVALDLWALEKIMKGVLDRLTFFTLAVENLLEKNLGVAESILVADNFLRGTN